MQMHRGWALAVAVCAACTGGDGAGSSSSSSGGSSSSSGGASSSAAGSSSAGSSSAASSSGASAGSSTASGGSSSEGIPARRAACASPAITVAGLVTSTAGTLGNLAASWGGTEGAVAYVRLPAAHVFLRRFDVSGQLLGTEVDLGTTGETANPAVTLASDGAHHVACWQADGLVAAFTCASVAVGADAAVAGATVNDASSPSVALGPGGFMLAYASTTMWLQRLTGTAALDGAATQAGGNTSFVALTGSDDGWGLAFQPTSGGLRAVNVAAQGFVTAALYTLADVGHFSATLPLGWVGVPGGWAAAWYDAATNGGKIVAAAVGAIPHAATEISGTSVTYGKLSAAAGVDSIAVAWSDFGGSFLYRALDARGVPLASGSAVTILAANWDDNANALTAVTNGFVFAGVRPTSAGGPFDTIQLVHLGCP